MIPEKFLSRKFLETLLMPAIVVLVGVGAFGLGRLSAMQENKTPLRILGSDGSPARPIPWEAEGGGGEALPAAAGAAAGFSGAFQNGTKD